MKRFIGVNFYDLLEVSPTATKDQIRQAYEMAKKTYSDDSMVTYSLFDAQSRKQIQERIEQAFLTLADEGRRKAYDIELGLEKTEPKVHVVSVDQPPVTDQPAAVDPSPMPPKSLPSAGFEVRDEEISGPFLKDLREKQDIPMQEIADNTRINITYLEYIERENFKSLPAEVYLKGYLEQYSRYLGLNPETVTAGFLRLLREWKSKKELL